MRTKEEIGPRFNNLRAKWKLLLQRDDSQLCIIKKDIQGNRLLTQSQQSIDDALYGSVKNTTNEYDARVLIEANIDSKNEWMSESKPTLLMTLLHLYLW